MSTELQILVNLVDADLTYQTASADYMLVDLNNDYLIWTAGSAAIKDKMTYPPTTPELNEASTSISTTAPTTVALCLLYDSSATGGWYTRKVIGMGENKRYVFCFSFNGATATEPRLEAWDTAVCSTAVKNVLGAGTPANSMIKAVCTTYIAPGASWSGTAIAGYTYVLLNGGLGALDDLPSGQVSQESYANVKIVIPQSYSTPGVDGFVLCCRYSWL